jgi:phage protein D
VRAGFQEDQRQGDSGQAREAAASLSQSPNSEHSEKRKRRAALLPEERMTARERKLIELGRREIEKGHYVTVDQLRKELGA